MTLPSGDEYLAAVQNPKRAFLDPDLQISEVEPTPQGLPKPYSGGFTTTFHLRNSRHWAARCFIRKVEHLEERYRSLSHLISQEPSSPLVEAACLSKGIQVGGFWHPIIKMIWVQGYPLNEFISRNLQRSTVISNLADGFIRIVRWLEGNGIAHGDLQHGNIIISNGRMYLIDYDGFYLPTLSNLPPNEFGHVNYQHPLRSLDHYGKEIDRFSTIVIYLALQAISLNPQLWQKYDNGENLLFKTDDFIHPNSSSLLVELRSLPGLREDVGRFIRICKSSYESIPTLEQFIDDKNPLSLIETSTEVTYTPRSQYELLDASSADQLIKHIGERVEVIGQITDGYSGKTWHGQPYRFLNFGNYPRHTLALVIWSEVLSVFESMGISPESYLNKQVSVTGVLSTYQSKPQIIIEYPSQIQIIPSRERPIVSPSDSQLINVPEYLTVRDLAGLLNVSLVDVMKRILSLGILVTADQMINHETAVAVANQFGFRVKSSTVDRNEVLPAYPDNQITRQKKRTSHEFNGAARVFNTLYKDRKVSPSPVKSQHTITPRSIQTVGKARSGYKQRPPRKTATPPKTSQDPVPRILFFIAVSAFIGYLIMGDLGFLIGILIGYLIGQALFR